MKSLSLPAKGEPFTSPALVKLQSHNLPTYEKNWHWGAVGAYPLAMSLAEMKIVETELRQLVAAVAVKRGVTGRRGSQARQGISRKLRSRGLRSPYALAIRAELTN